MDLLGKKRNVIPMTQMMAYYALGQRVKHVTRKLISISGKPGQPVYYDETMFIRILAIL